VTTAGGTIETGLAPNRAIYPGRSRTRSRSPERSSYFPAWIILAGAILPIETQITLGGAKWTAGRIGILLLLVPAVVAFCHKTRRTQACDLLAIATGIWMVLSAFLADGANSLPSACAESLEFLGAYLVGRGLFFSTPSLHRFVGVLKAVTLIVVAAGLADNLSGRLLVHDTLSAAFNTLSLQVGFRYDIARAASTFDHAILFGSFCSFVAAIFIYSESRALSRVIWVCVALLGCISSLSSIAILSVVIVISTYIYDRAMTRMRWRWKAFAMLICGLLAFLFLFSNNPISWIISHLTLDPETGFFRLMIWDAAFIQIANFPWIGIGFREFGNDILDATVDCVWLAETLRFGIPMAVLLFLTNITAFLPTRRPIEDGTDGGFTVRLRTGFTVVLVIFMFSGLTVHFWNYLWIFWGLCVGIRASLGEREIYAAR
jgi:hypothetical protein